MLLLSPLAVYGFMPLADVVAEHRAYISGLGVDLLLAWLLTFSLRYRWALVISAVVALGALTVQRNQVWANSKVLWQDAERKSPLRVRPHINLGEAYQHEGQVDAALQEYRHAIALNSRLTPVFVNMGSIYIARNELQLAEESLKSAVALSPDLPESYINLALIALRRNQVLEAQQWVDRAAPLNPNSYLLRFTRGEVYMAGGRLDEAAEEYEAAVRLRPDLQDLREQADRRLARLRELRGKK